MGLISKTVNVLMNGSNMQYYKNLGYDVHYRQILTIPPEQLPDGSCVKVDCTCDYCGKSLQQYWKTYKRAMDKPVKKVCCRECKPLKEREGYELKNGGVWGNQTQEAKLKKKKTMIERYGVDNAVKSPELMEKRRQRMLEKWGYEEVWYIPEIKERCLKVIREKYGVDHISQAQEVKEKIAQSYYNNGSGKTSTQQLYLYQLLGGELNYPCSSFNIDICLKDDDQKYAVEYNGSGHDAAVTMHLYTKSQFLRKEIYRCKVLKENHYKRIDIDSKKDYLPSDDKILEMIEYAKQFFIKNPDRSWIKFSIDQSKIYDAEHKDGVPYDFGELRRVRKEDIA